MKMMTVKELAKVTELTAERFIIMRGWSITSGKAQQRQPGLYGRRLPLGQFIKCMRNAGLSIASLIEYVDLFQ